MQNSQNHLLSALLFAGFLFSIDASSQERKVLSDSTGTSSYIITRGQEAVVLYDTAYVLNKRMYFLLKGTYDNARKGIRDVSTRRLMEVYDSIISLQDGMIRNRTEDYENLKRSFDDLTSNTGTFLTRTETNVNAIDKSVGKVTDQVTSIKATLEKSISDLKLQQKQRLRIFIGGLSVGIGATALIFLIAK